MRFAEYLAVFVEVCRLGSFSAAARRRRIPQLYDTTDRRARSGSGRAAVDPSYPRCKRGAADCLSSALRQARPAYAPTAALWPIL